MTYKTILAAASGGAASAGAMELACRLAVRFGAHVEGFHVRIDAREIILASADGMGMSMPTDWIEAMTVDAIATAARTKASFDAVLSRHGLVINEKPAPNATSAAWHEETGFASDLLARRSRFFDLVVLGRSERITGNPSSGAIEQVLLHSGRPVLLAPAEAPKTIGKKIAVGWNGSPESVRALSTTLPLLAAADTVSIITVEARAEDDISSVIDYLAWHGISATHRHFKPVAGVSAGEQLLVGARELAADLLVMGGYGRAPWREVIFGGATREIIGSSLLPILMSH